MAKQNQNPSTPAPKDVDALLGQLTEEAAKTIGDTGVRALITQDFANESKKKFDAAEAIKIAEGFVSLGGAYEEAEKPRRHTRADEVATACQAVCPTRAIRFGDLNDPASAVVAAKASPLDYHLLEDMNTRPRTSYLTRVLNPDPELG